MNKANTSIEKQNAQKVALLGASLLGLLAGSPVVPASSYIKTLEDQDKLKKDIKSLEKVNRKYLRIICKLLVFLDYRSKWKKLTKSIEARTQKLKENKLDCIPQDISPEMQKNLSQALQCYTLNLNMASYIMILRSIEIGVNELYKLYNPQKINQNNGKVAFVSASVKLSWCEEQGYLKGADYRIAKAFIEGRNEAVHEIYEPSDLQILSAIELVVKLIAKLKKVSCLCTPQKAAAAEANI